MREWPRPARDAPVRINTRRNPHKLRAMRLQPFVRVDDVCFTATAAELRLRRGPPRQETLSAIGMRELDYGNVVLRFQESTGRLEEVTRRAPIVYLIADGGVADIPFTALASFVHVHDPAAFQRAAFLISPRYGLAFVPDEPDWLTALARHCIPTWRALGQRAD